MTPFRYVLIGYALLFPFACAYFLYRQPAVSKWLFGIALVCVVPFVISSLVIFFWGDRKSRWIFFTAWLWYFLLFTTPIVRLAHYVATLGIRVYVWNVDEFVASRCDLNEFFKNGVKFKVGMCDGFNDDPVFERLVYDSSGEIMLPLARRSPEWMDAMWNSRPRKVLRDSEDRADHLFGNFYLVTVHLTELEG